MVEETTLETVTLTSLVDNPYITEWRDYGTPNESLIDDIVKEDGTVKLLKHFYVTAKGAITQYPDKYVLLNGKAPKDIILQQGKQDAIECFVLPNVNDDNLKDYVNILNKERNLKDWEKCEKALAYLPPSKQGQDEGRWAYAIRKAGVDISEDTLQRYLKAKTYDIETNNEHQLLDKIKGKVKRAEKDGKPAKALDIKTAALFAERKKKKKQIHDSIPNEIVIPEENYKDVIADFMVWCQDNKKPWQIADETVQLIMCSTHYLNQRKYTKDGIEYKPVKLYVYLNQLVFAFKQAYGKLKKSGVLCINIADAYKNGENYNVICRLINQLCDRLGFHFLFKQVWHKDGGLFKGHEHTMPTYDYEEILYFSKTKNEYYFNPIKYYDRSREIELGYFNGRLNPDGSYTSEKWTVSPEFETFKQFISNKHFENVIVTATAGADSKRINEKYGLKHPALMPLVIPLFPILCYSKPGDIVMDPWLGTGTTLKVSLALGRKARGMDLEQRFVDMAQNECQEIINHFQ